MSNNALPRIYFHSSEKYTHEILKRTLEKFSDFIELIDSTESVDLDNLEKNVKSLVWLEYEDLPFEKLQASSNPASHNYNTLFANSYCIRKGLIRKAQNSNCIKHYIAKNPDSILTSGIPETWILELDDLDYLDEALDECFEVRDSLIENESIFSGEITDKKTTKFILKPSMTSKGAGIYIFDSLERLEKILQDELEDPEEEEEVDESESEDKKEIDWSSAGYGSAASQIREFVIQRYVDNPLLLKSYGSRKFHIRTYCAAISGIKVFVYKQMLALFASSTYDRNFENPADVFSHITNTHVQTENKEFDPNNVVFSFWDLANSAEGYLDNDINVSDLENIYSQIKKLTGEVFDAVSNQPTNFQPWPNCFEVFGLDFIVDDNFNVFFLEANAYPDFKQTGQDLQNIVHGFLDSVSNLAVSEFFDLDLDALNVDRKFDDNLELVLTKQLSGSNFKRI
ncbi:putative tubulin-tyrosine ligase [Smittium culicis]|uniref:Putative tubulin-tyrosine ligase n=1 Tax=Smittium culicis TaxID=133412 RepID=A0A1R1XCQ6_9FUNG|nr:putative tubulin-tyrosine ligase [Smittium culicis]OMJ15369.1 putative tubulin-tyrosine ligase [Smittium culicis]